MYVVILAGGSGSRLWPWSRENYPKQLLSIKEGEGSLFQETVLRLKDMVPFENVVVVTNKNQAKELKEQFFQATKKDCVFLNEPVAKNTAPAIGLAMFYLYQKDPQSVMAVFPADHYISPKEKYINLLERAVEGAREHGIITFGINPDRPETGYGYIKTGENLKRDIYKVDRFVEKPDLEKAKKYIQDGNYLWNSGMFVFRVADMIEEYQKYLPGMTELLKKIDYTSFSNLEGIYHQIEGTSIDYGIIEKSERVSVIKANINWNDVGDWQAIYELLPRDEQGNFIEGNVYSIDSKNSLLLGDKRVVGVIGVDDLIIVDTPDALLICSQDKAQDVKKLIDLIRKNNT